MEWNEILNKRNKMKKRIRKIWEVKNEMKGSEMKNVKYKMKKEIR